MWKRDNGAPRNSKDELGSGDKTGGSLHHPHIWSVSHVDSISPLQESTWVAIKVPPPDATDIRYNTQQMTGISEGITLSQTTRTLQVQQRRSQCSQQVPELLVGVTPLFFTVQAGITSQARPLNDARSYILM